MFIGGMTRSGSDRNGQQVAAGLYLLLFQDPQHTGLRPPLAVAVRHVNMRQLGHFMMGEAQVGPHRITLSGPYGNDGLPLEAEPGLWPHLVPLPQELQDAFWTGGGHNSAGKEASAIRAWASARVKTLRKAGSITFTPPKEVHPDVEGTTEAAQSRGRRRRRRS